MTARKGNKIWATDKSPCLNCAFLTRCRKLYSAEQYDSSTRQEITISLNHLDKTETLTKSERDQIINGSWKFMEDESNAVGKWLEDCQKWREELSEHRQIRDDKFKVEWEQAKAQHKPSQYFEMLIYQWGVVNNILDFRTYEEAKAYIDKKRLSEQPDIVTKYTNSNPNIVPPKQFNLDIEDSEILGMRKHPIKPHVAGLDFITCHKQQWTDENYQHCNNNKDIRSFKNFGRNKLPNKQCECYFSFKHCVGLSMDAIETKQRNKENLRAISITKWIAIATLIATIIGWFLR